MSNIIINRFYYKMKTLTYISAILFLILISSCTTNETIEEVEEIEEIIPKNIELIFTTSQLNFDEIVVSYYNFDTSEWIYGPMQFTYDANGNPEPIIISIPDYTFNTIEGEAYRKNNLEFSLKVQVYVDEVLSFETESIGTALDWAHVNFTFTIEE